ncbi:MAG: purine-nucleoside phosphorylase [Anaerolineae bacterium]|nr:purine-nucleoside phosphorylase [Anaerolineae bacterium]
MQTEAPYQLEGHVYTRREVEQLASDVLERCPGSPPEIGFIIGTGFASFAEEIENPVTIPYSDLPLWPPLNCAGHIEELVIGDLAGRRVACARGKIFLLDGAPAQVVALPVRLFYAMGCRKLLYTSTVGAIDPSFRPGEFILITNHINLTGRNPLVGEPNGEWGATFFDMSHPYDAEYIAALRVIAAEEKIRLHDAVYGCVLGPSFETAAEIKMLGIVGAHAVGMSTVPDVIAARQLAMRVAAFGFISNMAAGVTEVDVDNDDILGLARTRYADYAKLARGILARM